MTRPKTPGRVTPIEDKTVSGRPRKVAPPDAADVIRKACALGASKVGVAMALACSVTVLERWLDEDPALKEAFAQGRERERQMLHGVLHDAAKGGNIIAAIYLTKSRHGYREGADESQANRVSVTFNIPAATPLNQFMVLENEPNNSAKPVSAKLTRGS